MAAVTWNPDDKSSELTLSNNNLTVTRTGTASAWVSVRATASKSAGKHYFEVRIDANNPGFAVGVATAAHSSGIVGKEASGWGWNGWDIRKYHNSSTGTSYGTAAAVGDVIGVAVDLDTGKIWWSLNGTWMASGDPAGGLNPAFSNVAGEVLPMGSIYSPSTAGTARFKAADFTYTPPTGFSAWEEVTVFLSGTITEDGVTVARTVRAYRRDTGALLAEQTSAADGTYSFTDLGGYTGEVYVIALDDDASHNDLIYDRIVVS